MRLLFGTLVLCFALSACGKKAPLKVPPPPGEKEPEQEVLLK